MGWEWPYATSARKLGCLPPPKHRLPPNPLTPDCSRHPRSPPLTPDCQRTSRGNKHSATTTGYTWNFAARRGSNNPISDSSRLVHLLPKCVQLVVPSCKPQPTCMNFGCYHVFEQTIVFIAIRIFYVIFYIYCCASSYHFYFNFISNHRVSHRIKIIEHKWASTLRFIISDSSQLEADPFVQYPE